MIHHLLAHLLRPDTGKLERDSTISVGIKFNVCPRTVKRIWKQFFSTLDGNCVGGNVKSRIANNSGRNKKYTNVVDTTTKATDADKRCNTQREELAANTGLSQSQQSVDSSN